MLRSELRNVSSPTTPAGIDALARFAAQRIRAGHNPFDAWYPYLGLGSPQFLAVPVAVAHPHRLAEHRVRRLGVPLDQLPAACARWPISVYIGARLFGLDRWQAGAAALFSPMLVNVIGLRLRVGELRLARQRHVVDAVGALAHADRARARVARGREGRALRARRRSWSGSRARSTSSPGTSCCSRSACSCSLRPRRAAEAARARRARRRRRRC